MAFDKLPVQEQKLILQCMKLILDEPFIKDSEFQTRLGINREQLREVIQAWPHLDDDTNTRLAINNSLNEVLNSWVIKPSDWAKWFDVPKDEVEKAYDEWASLRGRARVTGQRASSDPPRYGPALGFVGSPIADLRQRRDKTRHHLEAARVLLPTSAPAEEEASASNIKLFEHWLRYNSQRDDLDGLHYGFVALERAGELSDCPPEFWLHLAAAAGQMQEQFARSINFDLQQAEAQLTRFTMGATESVQGQITSSPALVAVSEAGYVQRQRSYGRLTTQQDERYVALLHNLRALLPQIKQAGVNIPPLVLTEIEQMCKKV